MCVRAHSVLNSRANCCRIIGRLEEAVTGFRASLKLWRRLGEVLREGMALHNLGIVAYQLQDYGEAGSSLRQAARCFEEVGSSQWSAAAQNELGLVYRDQGRWEEALTASSGARALFAGDFNLDLLQVRSLVQLDRPLEAIEILDATHVLPSENACESCAIAKT